MKIGARNLKTALAVFMCVVISYIFKLQYPFFVTISAVVAMERTVSYSLKAGQSRILGTLVGAAVGLIGALIYPGNPFITGLGIIIVIYFCGLFGWSKSVPIATFVFLAIMLSLNGKNPWVYSLNRIIDTSIGIGVALLINYLVYPPSAVREIYGEAYTISESLLDLLNKDLTKISSAEVEDIDFRVSKLGHQLYEHKHENTLRKKDVMRLSKAEEAARLFENIIGQLRVIERLKKRISDNERVEEKFRQNDFDKIYSYHSDEINQDIEWLRKIESYLNEGYN